MLPRYLFYSYPLSEMIPGRKRTECAGFLSMIWCYTKRKIIICGVKCSMKLLSALLEHINLWNCKQWNYVKNAISFFFQAEDPIIGVSRNFTKTLLDGQCAVDGAGERKHYFCGGGTYSPTELHVITCNVPESNRDIINVLPAIFFMKYQTCNRFLTTSR